MFIMGKIHKMRRLQYAIEVPHATVVGKKGCQRTIRTMSLVVAILIGSLQTTALSARLPPYFAYPAYCKHMVWVKKAEFW